MSRGDHGDPDTYSHAGCRCDPCKEGKREYEKQNKANRLAGIGAPIPHGTPRGYGIGCDCIPCWEAHREYQKGVRQRGKEVRRQLQERNMLIVAERNRLARVLDNLTRDP